MRYIIVALIMLWFSPVYAATLIEPIEKASPKDKEALLSLSLNTYHEARGLETYDQIIGAQVVMNRLKMKDKKGKFVYKSVREVVFAPRQFSWTNELNKDKMPKDQQAWLQCQMVSYMVYTKKVPDYSKGATHYYAPELMELKRPPSWIRDMKKIKTVGSGKHQYYAQNTSRVTR